MKDYKLSELKETCKKYCKKGELVCESVSCPIQEECFQIAVAYFSDLEIDKGESENE